MIRYCKIKHCIIGFDRPKICVPLVGRSAEEIIAQADQIRQSQRSSAIDMVELRGDYLDILPDYEVLDRLLAKVAEILPEKVLLFTIRSEAEGGEKLAFTTPTIYEINRHVIEKATADMVDIELFSGAEQAEEMIGIAKEKGVKIIMSNHDFQTTPDASTIVNRLRSMQDLGADVAKIAVMPENKMHVVNLLAATAMMQEAYAEVPVVTMSMGKMGAISRISGQVFGSAISFASFAEASAPGQIPVDKMDEALTLIEKYCN